MHRNATGPRVHYIFDGSLECDVVSKAVKIVTRIHCDQDLNGDFMVFLPGVKVRRVICHQYSTSRSFVFSKIVFLGSRKLKNSVIEYLAKW